MPGTSETTSVPLTVGALLTPQPSCKTWPKASTQDAEGQAPPTLVRPFFVKKTTTCLSATLPLLLCHPFSLWFPSPLSTFSFSGLSSGLSDDLNMEVNHQQEYYGLSMRTVMSREYSERTLSLACASSALLSLLAGFLAGYCFFKRCNPARGDKMNCGHAYLEAQVRKLETFYLLTHQRHTVIEKIFNLDHLQMLERQATKAMVESDLVYDPPYTTPAALATTKNNLLSNQPVVSKETMKTNLTVTNTGGTLGKCKKVYL